MAGPDPDLAAPDTHRQARFEALARAVADPVHRYLVRRIGADDAEDLLADTLLVLWRRLDDVPAEAALPWSIGVARGVLANARRAEGRRLRLIHRVAAQASVAQPGDVQPGDVQPGDAQADHADLLAALAALPDADREVVQLWAWEGLSPAEIAAVTGRTANAVSIRLHRAKKRLAVALARKGADAGGQERDEGGDRP